MGVDVLEFGFVVLMMGGDGDAAVRVWSCALRCAAFLRRRLCAFWPCYEIWYSIITNEHTVKNLIRSF